MGVKRLFLTPVQGAAKEGEILGDGNFINADKRFEQTGYLCL